MALADSQTSEFSEDELNALTKSELVVLAHDMGVEGVSATMLKADIISAILNK